MRNYGFFAPTPDNLIEAKLDLAAIRSQDLVFDLGCGDCRVLIQAAKRFDARGVGVDIRQHLVDEAKENVVKEGLEQQIEIVCQDFLDTDLTSADVVILYLDRNSLGQLSRKLEDELKPGARIVTHIFDLPAWKEVKKVEFGTFSELLYLYQK